MMNEVEFLSGLGVNLIYFLDDLFTCDKGRVERFCSRMQKSNLKMKWVAQCRIDNLTKDLLKLMKNSGCACLNIGVESGSERILKKLRKDLDLGKVEAMARYCRSVGINTVGNFILGSPGEEDADRIKSIKFARKANFDIIEVLFFTPYPGSYAFREYGRLDKVDQYCRYEKVTQNQETIDRERIERFRNFFYKKFYLRAGFLSRNIPMYIYSAVLNGRNEWRLLRKAMRYIIF